MCHRGWQLEIILCLLFLVSFSGNALVFGIGLLLGIGLGITFVLRIVLILGVSLVLITALGIPPGNIPGLF